MFNYSNIKNSEATITKTWHEFREALAKNNFRYDDVISALNETFLKVLDDLFVFENNQKYFAKKLDTVNKSKIFIRGALISPDENISLCRFIPDKKFIKEDNRFSPYGVEWLYIALGDDFLQAEECSKMECGINPDKTYISCTFELSSHAKKKNIIDLTVGTEYSFDMLNKTLDEKAELLSKKAVVEFFKGVPVKDSVSEIRPVFTEWVIHTYAKLMSEQLFVPVDTDNKSYTYAPFHCLAQYFINKGFAGIIYSSTVYPNGKNLVLFDKSDANPVKINTNINHYL